MSKFKVGDRIRVLRNVAPLVPMKNMYIGKVYEVKGVPGSDEKWGAKYDIDETFVVWDAEVEPATLKAKILITTDGTTTLARLYDGKKVVKSAQAKCAPSDTFDFNLGANLAYDRLMGRAKVEPKPAEKPQDKTAEPVKLYCTKTYNGMAYTLLRGNVYMFINGTMCDADGKPLGVGSFGLYMTFDDYKKRNPDYGDALCPLVKRPAKVGEWVYVTEKNSHRPRKDIYNVVGVGTDNCVWFECDGTGNVTESKYLVLDGYRG